MDFLKCYVKNASNPSKDSTVDDISENSVTGDGSVSKSLKSQKKAIPANSCPHCGYVKPFCYYYLVKECSNIANRVPHGTEKGVYEA